MITHTAARGKVVPYVPVLTVSSRFKKYKPEHENIVRRPDVKSDLTHHILVAWKKFVKIAAKEKLLPFFDAVCFKNIHIAAVQEIRGIPRVSRTAKAVELFSVKAAALEVDSYLNPHLGLFLSALVNIFPGNDFVLHINLLDIPPDFLGYRNTKNLKIQGSVGDCFCEDMRKGNVIVNGSAMNFLCESMTGGSVLIKGDVGIHLGMGLVGGKIRVEGDAASEVGASMRGGIVRVMGKIKGIADTAEGGKIYSGGKLVFNEPSISTEDYLENEYEKEIFQAMDGDNDG